MQTGFASTAAGRESSAIDVMSLGRRFLTSRGINEQTWRRWHVAFDWAVFEGQRRPAVQFRYLRGEHVVNWKARAVDTKLFTQMKGGEACFWNLDRVLASPMDEVFVVEGEMDALSLAEAGVPDVAILSVPNGAPAEAAANAADSRRYEHALAALEAGLKKAKRVILCVDNDAPGRALRADLVSIFGPAKCWTVDWPSNVKDANDALMQWGPEDLNRYVHDAQKPWPIAGLYTLSEIPEAAPLTLWEPEFVEWKGKLRLAPTMVSVMTGYPGHGKTAFSQQLWFGIAKRYNLRIALFSAETPAKPHVRRALRQYYHGFNEWILTPEQIAEADEWIDDRFVFIMHPNARPTFPWLMDMTEAAVHRYGCRAVVIDPWNKLEADFDPGEKTETQWIGDCLDQMLDAARALDVHIQVLAHPAKPPSERRKLPPDLYSISGSQHWNNRVDQGFCIHRPKIVDGRGERCTQANLLHLKARFADLGWPCKLSMQFNLSTGRYEPGADTVDGGDE